MTKDCIKAILGENLYDYVANNYYVMSKEDLKNIILELDYAISHNVERDDYKQINIDVASELMECIC